LATTQWLGVNSAFIGKRETIRCNEWKPEIYEYISESALALSIKG